MKIKNEHMIDAKKEHIIQIAKQIILEEGLDKLSIRKIAVKLNQTPGIVYHYFKSKDEILLTIVDQGYGEILQTIASYMRIENPEQRLHDSLYAYMNLMIEKNQLFMIMMQSNIEEIQNRVNVLNCDASKRKSISMLSSTIEIGIAEGVFQCEDAQLRARTIWASVYGLITHIVTENIHEQLKEELIEDQIEMIITSLKGEK